MVCPPARVVVAVGALVTVVAWFSMGGREAAVLALRVGMVGPRVGSGVVGRGVTEGGSKAPDGPVAKWIPVVGTAGLCVVGANLSTALLAVVGTDVGSLNLLLTQGSDVGGDGHGT